MKVAVIGAGTMGAGIAQVASTAGCEVRIFDTFPEAISGCLKRLEKDLLKLEEKGKIDAAARKRILENIDPANSLQDLAGSQLVIEAIAENLEAKRHLFSSLESIVGNECLLASNTSSLSISSIAASCKNPQRVLGIHFFNPAPVMQLVEVVPAVQTTHDIIKSAVQIISSWGKTVAVAKDTPGFIVNRVARPFYSEALRIYDEGIADFSTIDWSMKTFGGFRMGPFELMDFIGNDVNYAVTESVFQAFYFDPRYKPSHTQKRLTEAGYLGRKSGRGYYDYQGEMPSSNQNQELGKIIFERILVMLINEAADALMMNIASAKDIDDAMTKGVNYPKGLLAWADEKGIDWCIRKMDALYDEYHEDRYRCSSMLRRMNRENKKFFV